MNQARMGRVHRWGGLALCALALGFAGCKSSDGSFLIIELSAGGGFDPAGLARVRLQTTIGGVAKTDELLPRGGAAAIILPTRARYELTTASGAVTVQAIGFNAGGAVISAGSGTGAIEAGGSETVSVVLRAPGDFGDGGAPDGGGGAGGNDGSTKRPAHLVVEPPMLDFGSVLVGNRATTMVILRNDGDEPTGAISIEPDPTGMDIAHFELQNNGVNPCQGALAPDATCAFVLVFAPTSAGSKKATGIVRALPGGMPTFTAQGIGITPGALTVAPSEHDFGMVAPMALGVRRSFRVSNTGQQPTGALNVELQGGGAAQFRVVQNGCAGRMLGAGQTCDVEANFTPAVRGTFAASLNISGSPGGTAPAALRGTGASAAILSLAPEMGAGPAFGDVVLPMGKTYVFVVTNAGDATSGPLQFSMQGGQMGEFQIQAPAAGDCLINQPLTGGARCTLRVTFQPAALGSRGSRLQVTADPGGNPGLDLSGNGVQAPGILVSDTPSFAFPPQEVGTSSAPFVWTIRNTGNGPSGALMPNSTNTADFTVVSSTCTGMLPAGRECSVQIAFSPNMGGQRSGVFSLTANPGGQVTLNVSGTGMYRLTVMNQGGGTGTVTAIGTGIDCGAACTTLINGGDRVGLRASTTNGSDSLFTGWSGACSGMARTCDLAITAHTTVGATFVSAKHNIVFASSRVYAADLGGFKPYDIECNTLATDAGINNGSSNGYIALISTTDSKATNRLGTARGFIRMDGQPFADDVGSLFGANKVWNAVRFTETGEDRWSAGAMTGTYSDGGIADTGNCKDFTTTDGNSSSVVGGQLNAGPFGWTGGAGWACNAALSIICMGNTKNTPIAPVPVVGRRIWLSSRSLRVAAESPDAVCGGERPAGVAAARAYIAYPNMPAAAVLDMASSYVRMDGVLVGTGAEIVAGGQPGGILRSGIWQSADGIYRSAPFTRTWTGGTTPSTPGTVGSTCNNWSTRAATGIQGFHNLSNSQSFHFLTNNTCDDQVTFGAAHVYCVQTNP